MTRLTWQEAVTMQEKGINHDALARLRRHLKGALMAVDEILYQDQYKTVKDGQD